MRNKNLISSLLTFLMLVPAVAQQPAAPSTVTFKANSNLVIVNVSAKDKGGLPVEGLKAEDFTVPGRRQAAESLRVRVPADLRQAGTVKGTHSG